MIEFICSSPKMNEFIWAHSFSSMIILDFLILGNECDDQTLKPSTSQGSGE